VPKPVWFRLNTASLTGGTLDYLKLWSSVSRGPWLPAVEYWASPSKSGSRGVHFENGCESEALQHILDSVMQHQTEFSLPERMCLIFTNSGNPNLVITDWGQTRDS
jgi:hypothetical protein